MNPDPEIFPKIVYKFSLFMPSKQWIWNKQNSIISKPCFFTALQGEKAEYLDNMTPFLPIENQ